MPVPRHGFPPERPCGGAVLNLARVDEQRSRAPLPCSREGVERGASNVRLPSGCLGRIVPGSPVPSDTWHCPIVREPRAVAECTDWRWTRASAYAGTGKLMCTSARCPPGWLHGIDRVKRGLGRVVRVLVSVTVGSAVVAWSAGPAVCQVPETEELEAAAEVMRGLPWGMGPSRVEAYLRAHGLEPQHLGGGLLYLRPGSGLYEPHFVDGVLAKVTWLWAVPLGILPDSMMLARGMNLARPILDSIWGHGGPQATTYGVWPEASPGGCSVRIAPWPGPAPPPGLAFEFVCDGEWGPLADAKASSARFDEFPPLSSRWVPLLVSRAPLIRVALDAETFGGNVADSLHAWIRTDSQQDDGTFLRLVQEVWVSCSSGRYRTASGVVYRSGQSTTLDPTPWRVVVPETLTEGYIRAMCSYARRPRLP